MQKAQSATNLELVLEGRLVCCPRCGSDEIELLDRAGAILAVCDHGHVTAPQKLVPRPNCPRCGEAATVRIPEQYDEFGLPTAESAVFSLVVRCSQCRLDGYLLDEEYVSQTASPVRWNVTADDL